MLPLDYSNRYYWMHAPSQRNRSFPVDVFFVYPTVYVHPDKSRHHLMPIHSAIFRTAARVSAWWHDRIFASCCNIFAPYYRQVGMETLWMNRADFLRISHVPYEDIRSAFFYYLRNLNGGRPFLLGGHSQGSEVLLRLLCEDFGDLPAAKRMIAAYLIGFSVTKGDLEKYPHVRMAKGPDDLGCVISYNTTAKGLKLMPVVRPGSIAINPLNWRSDSAYAPKDMNYGSVLLETKHFCIEKKHFTGAWIDEEKGVLMIDTNALDELLHVRIGFLNRMLMHRQSLHTLDIALFQRNLEQNIALRIGEYLKRTAVRTNPEYAEHLRTEQLLAETGI